MLRRILDLFLIFAILIGVGFLVYELGRNVDNTSNNLARHDSELNQTVVRRPKAHGPSHHTIELVVISVTSAAGVMLLVSFGSALMRTQRRQRWRAP